MTTPHYQEHLATIAIKLAQADAILVGGASGMSSANQHDFYGYSKYFRDNFGEFRDAYGIRNLCDALYYRYETCEERWAYLAKHGALLYDEPPGKTYIDLHALIKDKNYFIVTTNQDLQFSKLFPDENLCYPQGTSHYLQCGVPCHDEVYPSEQAVRTLAANITGTRVPADLIPKCPRCGAPMEPWFRSRVFLEGSFWQAGMRKYQNFIEANSHKNILLIELGVGPMTPNIIKHPFSVATYHWPHAFLLRINKGEPPTHELLRDKAITLDADIAQVLHDLRAHVQAPVASLSACPPKEPTMTEPLRAALDRLQAADAVVIGASNGLSIAEGIHIFAENEDFATHFAPFRKQHGFHCIIQGCFHPYPSEAHKWAFFSRMHAYFTDDKEPGQVMRDLRNLVQHKPHFVVTSNIDAHFHLAGFDPAHLFEIEGNCQQLQCANACHDQLYQGDEILNMMASSINNGTVPEHLIPICPQCGGPMQVHIELDRMFLKGSTWQTGQRALSQFLNDAHGKKIVFLELGVGARNQLIKEPLMRIAEHEPHASYLCFNRGAEVYIPKNIADKAIGIDGDIAHALRRPATMTEDMRRSEPLWREAL